MAVSTFQATYGTLVVAGLVDREHKGSYTLQITAADGGVPISRKVRKPPFSFFSLYVLKSPALLYCFTRRPLRAMFAAQF